MIIFRRISFKTKTLLITTFVFLILLYSVFTFIFDSNNTEELQENEIIAHEKLMNFYENDYENGANRSYAIIFSSWRSGSTFLGDIINSVPATYYHYEPFVFRHEQRETNNETLEHVINLLKCQFGSSSAKKHTALHKFWFYNKRLIKYCGNIVKRFYGDFYDSDLCYRVSFREKFCDIFPRQLMKLIRARVSLAEALLSNTNFDVRIILEIRDPRAVYNSRKTFSYCKYNQDCYSIERYCEFQIRDYYDVQVLLEKYPDRIRVLRYEELASDPFNESKKLLSFLHLPFASEVQEFLETHTKYKQGDIFSTYRDSKNALVHWMKDLKKEEIEYVQDVCQKAMKLWSYKNLE